MIISKFLGQAWWRQELMMMEGPSDGWSHGGRVLAGPSNFVATFSCSIFSLTGLFIPLKNCPSGPNKLLVPSLLTGVQYWSWDWRARSWDGHCWRCGMFAHNRLFRSLWADERTFSSKDSYLKDENKNDVEYTEDRGDQRDLWSAGVGRAFRSAGSHICAIHKSIQICTKHI